ncbi:MAG: PD-(D/E)XK nuclease family protein [Actinomycetes bacterium]|jgi:putative RecB family exonuclease
MDQIRLSPSRVGDFTNCPKLYKYRVIDQLPESISLDAERGTLVHSILHDLFESVPSERNLLKAQSLIDSRWETQVESKPELSALVVNEKEWKDRVTALLSTYFTLEKPAEFEPTFREIHLEMDLTQELYLHGYIDRLDIAPTGEVRIVDYKTGKSPKPGWEDKAFFQLRIYALIYWRNHGVIPNLLQLIYLGNGNVIKNVPNENALISTEKKLLQIGQEISDAMDKNDWPTKPSRLCDWCSFKPICPAHTA